MKSREWREYADKTLLEETVGDILLALPWESDNRDELRDQVLKIIESYQGRQTEMRIICVYWLMSTLLPNKTHRKFKGDPLVFYKMTSIARVIMNRAIKTDIPLPTVSTH